MHVYEIHVYKDVDSSSEEHLSPVIGLVGLGNMGGSIAERLALSAHEGSGRPLVFDIDRPRLEDIAGRLDVQPVDTIEGLADAEFVILCLPEPAASIKVVSTLSPLMRPGSVIIETSTVSPAHVEQMAQVADTHGVGFIDAALAAGVGQMRKGTAAGLVGGDPAHIEAAMPALDAFLERVYVIGDLGTGAALKVINNAVAHAVMVVLVEAAALASASGIDRTHLLRLMTGNDAGLTRPLEHRLIERIADGNYDGGMPTAAALKDSILAIDFARSRGVPIFAISGSHAVYEMATAQGFGRLDYASIAKLWEGWIGKSMSTEPT